MGLIEPNKQRYHFHETTTADVDYEVFEGTNTPVNGLVYANFDEGIEASALLAGPNGKPIESEIEFRNGFRMGWYREYYPNGQLREAHLHYFQLPLLFLSFDENGTRTRKFFATNEPDCRELISIHNLIDGELDDFLG